MSSNIGGTALKSAKPGQAGTAKQEGLCVNCEYQESCSFKRDPERPILFCEEFSVSSMSVRTLAESGAAEASEANKVSLYTGLCVNCDHQDGCAYLEAGKGGWHCEEYS